MQIFVKNLHGRTQTLDVAQEDTILDIKKVLEKKEGIPIPRQRFSGKLFKDSYNMREAKITKECTLNLCVGLCQKIYVSWQGNWLISKTIPESYHCFWSELTKDNIFTESMLGTMHNTNSVKNLTVYHLKKCIAKYLLLEPGEINLSYYGADWKLDDSLLLERGWGDMGIDFTATLKSGK